MDIEVQRMVQEIHNRPGRVLVVTAGAGTKALAWLLGVAGASRTLLEALIPYDEASFCDFLGQTPQQFVAIETAGLMAGRAIIRGRQLVPERHFWLAGEEVIGLACTATIITDRPKLGEHRAHVVAWTKRRIIRYNLHLAKGTRDREGEESLVSGLMLNALAEAYGMEARLPLALTEEDICERIEDDLAAAVEQLLQGRINEFILGADGSLNRIRRPKAILSGSFAPLHEGHFTLLRIASEILKQDVTFELTAANADKPLLTQEETLDRMLQFAGGHSILVTNAPTFVEKARLYPGTTFIVGYDTANRVLQSRFYDQSLEKMMAALAEIRHRGCSFLVAGRVDEEGTYHDATRLNVPAGYEDLFKIISESRFRLDISSTQLREGR